MGDCIHRTQISGYFLMLSQKITKSIAFRRFIGSWTIMLVVAAVATPAVNAAEWRLEPWVRVAVDLNDNPFLSIRTDNVETASGYIVEAAAKVAYASDKTNFYIVPELSSRKYGADAALDSNDKFLNLLYSHDTRSTNFRIRAEYNDESVRTSEILDTDFSVVNPDDIPDTDTGRISVRGRRTIGQVVPSFKYRLSDVSEASLTVDFIDVRYDDIFLGLLTDFTDTRANLTYRRKWSARNAVLLNGTFRNYRTNQGLNQVKGIGFNVGFERALTESSYFRAIIGAEETEISNNATDLNWVANVSYVRRRETTTLLAQYRRTISASGSGALSIRDSFNLNFTRRLSDLISAGIGARIYATNPVEVAISSIDERDYVQLRAQLIWHLSSAFSVEANYRYSFLDRVSLGESANYNQVTLWLNYIPTAFVRSR
jgi:hypothetical protein